MTSRRDFLKMLAITCLAPVRVGAGLVKAVPVRKLPTKEFLFRHTYLPLYTTPCCTEIATKIAAVQPMPTRAFADALEELKKIEERMVRVKNHG